MVPQSASVSRYLVVGSVVLLCMTLWLVAQNTRTRWRLDRLEAQYNELAAALATRAAGAGPTGEPAGEPTGLPPPLPGTPAATGESRAAGPREPQDAAAPAGGMAELPFAQGNVTQADVRKLLAEEFAARFPDVSLSAQDLDEAATAVVTMRAAQQELAALPFAPENAARMRALHRQVMESAVAFQRATHLSAREFVQLAGEGGIDNDATTTEEVVFEVLPSPGS